MFSTKNKLQEWRREYPLLSHARARELARKLGCDPHWYINLFFLGARTSIARLFDSCRVAKSNFRDYQSVRTREGFYHAKGGIEYSIARAKAYAPYCDLLWYCAISQSFLFGFCCQVSRAYGVSQDGD